MTTDQASLFAIFAVVFALFLWGRVRYDIVALGALAASTLLGVVPHGQVFSGFGHPATLIVALVLIVSSGLVRAGAVTLLAQHVADRQRPAGAHIALVGGLGALISGFINNIAALALLMPLDMQTARRAGRAAGVTLMPLAFLTILGGMITLIGTPPNIIIASIRADAVGVPFAMFDFAPVGGAVALAGTLFVALVGWRLVPARRAASAGTDIEDFIAELVVGKDSQLLGKRIAEIEQQTEERDAVVLSVLRDGKPRHGPPRNLKLRAGDVLMVEAGQEALEEFRAAFGLSFAEPDEDVKENDDETPRRRVDLVSGAGMVMIEAVVPRGARIEGRSAQAIGLSWRQDTVLMELSRQGRVRHARLRRTIIEGGDTLLLLVPADRRAEVVDWLGVIALTERAQPVTDTRRAWLAAALFACAVAAASFGLLTLPIGLILVTVAFTLTRILPIEDLYKAVDWPVVVLLGAMIPLGLAMESTGSGALVAGWLAAATQGLPPWVALLVLMMVTMTMSDILNNNATTLLAAPVALGLADEFGSSPDPFLMAVAVAASCAFLTPIGHQNNTVILGPGGYRFGDYWRMGLPLEMLVIAVGLPMILFVWPL